MLQPILSFPVETLCDLYIARRVSITLGSLSIIKASTASFSPRNLDMLLPSNEQVVMDQRLIFVSDPVAALLLMRDRGVRMVDQDRELVGFETYIVEQWTCSRNDPAISIITFTGNSHHRITASLFELSHDFAEWPSGTQSYISFMMQNQARRHDVQQGVIMVTNLSIFPSTLTILPVADGSVWRQLPQFRLNEALKRMGCAGRAGMTLLDPSEATLLRFRNVYRVSDKIPAPDGVVQMVRMCQIALHLFGILKKDYCDGLLCDTTSTAIRRWWREFGFHFYNTEPIDGSLGPSTVSALLGLLFGARNRLHACGTAFAKDPFDTAMMKRSIDYFQKSQKLQRSRRLDYATLQRLHKMTIKAAGQDGWLVQRAVKTTVAELGKGGEMMMGMVGAKDRGRIADVETTDLSQFITKCGGETCQWLWRGKFRKNLVRDQRKSNIDPPLKHEHPIIRYEASSSSSEDETASQHSPAGCQQPATLVHNGPTTPERGLGHRKTMLQSLGGRMTDAKSGLGRIRAVAHAKKDDSVQSIREALASSNNDAVMQSRQPEYCDSFKTPTPLDDQGRSVTKANRPASNLVGLEESDHSRVQDRNMFGHDPKGAKNRSISILEVDGILTRRNSDANVRHSASSSPPSVKPYIYSPGSFSTSTVSIKRSTSLPAMFSNGDRINSIATELPLRVSVEETLSDQEVDNHVCCNGTSQDPSLRNSLQAASAFGELEYVMMVSTLHKDHTDLWSRSSQAIEQLLIEANANALRIRETSASKCSQLNIDGEGSEQVMQDATDLLSERLREVEALSSKLEYELGLLHSKIDDVEGGIIDLDQQISALEGRQKFLESGSNDHWVVWIRNFVDRLGFSSWLMR